MIKSLLLSLSVCLLTVCGVPQQLLAQPNPPGTGSNTIQMFQGGSQNVWIAVYPPTTFTDGTPIPDGTAVQLRVYRSTDGGQTYSSRVTIDSGGSGFVGQGAAGSRRKPWIDAKLIAPVDNRAPYMVYLAVAAVVGGEEGPMTNANLTFQYYPSLVRYATPPASEQPDDDQPAGSGPLNGTYSVDGGSLTINQRGNRVTGTIVGGGQTVATLSGTYSGGVYRLNASVNYEGQRFSVPLTITMNGAPSGTASFTFEGETTTVNFRVSGRSIQVQG